MEHSLNSEQPENLPSEAFLQRLNLAYDGFIQILSEDTNYLDEKAAIVRAIDIIESHFGYEQLCHPYDDESITTDTGSCDYQLARASFAWFQTLLLISTQLKSFYNKIDNPDVSVSLIEASTRLLFSNTTWIDTIQNHVALHLMLDPKHPTEETRDFNVESRISDITTDQNPTLIPRYKHFFNNIVNRLAVAIRKAEKKYGAPRSEEQHIKTACVIDALLRWYQHTTTRYKQGQNC